MNPQNATIMNGFCLEAQNVVNKKAQCCFFVCSFLQETDKRLGTPDALPHEI